MSIERPTGHDWTVVTLTGPRVAESVLVVAPTVVDPRSSPVVSAGRRFARSNETEYFATCNAKDFFLFDDKSRRAPVDLDFYYVNLRSIPGENWGDAVVRPVAHRAEHGRLPDQDDRDRVIGLYRSFHSTSWPRISELVGQALECDEEFSGAFTDWASANGVSNLCINEQVELAAKQYVHLVSTCVLSPLPEHSPRPPDDPPWLGYGQGCRRSHSAPTGSGASWGTHRHPVPKTIGHAPSVGSSDGLFRRFPLDRQTRQAAARLARIVAGTEGPDRAGDELARIYEELIPGEERTEGGQFYTHPKLADAVVKWALPNTEQSQSDDPTAVPRVLDPACGSGTFTRAAYERIRELTPGLSHEAAVDRLTAIDVNRFPLRLTHHRLAARANGDPKCVAHLHNASFFEFEPTANSGRPASAVGHSAVQPDGLEPFDAVVGNPPYIRHENLHPDAKHFRAHLRAFGPATAQPYYDGAKQLSRRSDAYVYFVSHATRFLRDGGRLGFIVPSKWLVTRYGRSFQRFLFDHYKVTAIVGFNARAFEALVDTVLLLLERCPRADDRDATVTKFVHVREPMVLNDLDEIILAETPPVDESEVAVDTQADYRTVAIEQATLAGREAGKLGHFLTVPRRVVELVEHPSLVPLGSLAEVTYGNKTGANEFFFLDGDGMSWDIDDRFLHPAIKSIRDTDGRIVTEATCERVLLDVHDYAESVRDGSNWGTATHPEDQVKRALSRDGYDGLRDYIEYGERQNYHQRSTCAVRTVWFDLGELHRPEILHPKFFDDRIIALLNRDRLAPSNTVDGIDLDPDVDETVMAGILNSTVHKIILECWGRAEGGGALQLMTYEMETLPTVPPSLLSDDQEQRIARATTRLLDGSGSSADRALEEIDAILLDALDLDLSVEAVRELQDSMTQRRIRRGNEVTVPIYQSDAGEAG